MKLFIDLIGWAGAIMLLGAYWLNSTNKLNAQSIVYQGFNILGSTFFVINTLYHGAYPSTALNVLWVLIGVYYLIKNWKKADKL